MCHINCPKKGNCTRHPNKCGSCSRNTGKRDYYRPDYKPHWQYYPPYTAPYPHWTYYTTAGNTWTTTDNYTIT